MSLFYARTFNNTHSKKEIRKNNNNSRTLPVLLGCLILIIKKPYKLNRPF